MFDRLHQGAMRHGSRILFLFALVLFLVGMLSAVRSVGRFDGDNSLHPNWLGMLASLLGGFSWSVLPFMAAVGIDRVDRWLAAAREAPRVEPAGAAAEGQMLVPPKLS